MRFASDRTTDAIAGLRARPRRRRLPKDEGDRQIATMPLNILDRQFEAERPNQKWIADFTYIWAAEGWLYVSAVIDLFSRRVVGWSMSAGMTAQLVADALLMAVWRRGKPNELLHHSDQGPVRQRAVPAADGRQRHRLQHEPIRQCLGQRGDGKLLLVPQDRAHSAQNLSHQE
jgi:transposase InsO family protein